MYIIIPNIEAFLQTLWTYLLYFISKVYIMLFVLVIVKFGTRELLFISSKLILVISIYCIAMSSIVVVIVLLL